MLLVAAGNETTRNAISHGMKALSDNPDEGRKWAADFEAVTPTAVPSAALSETELADALLSETAPTSASSASLRLTVKACVDVEPSVEVAVTVTVCEVAVS